MRSQQQEGVHRGKERVLRESRGAPGKKGEGGDAKKKKHLVPLEFKKEKKEIGEGDRGSLPNREALNEKRVRRKRIRTEGGRRPSTLGRKEALSRKKRDLNGGRRVTRLWGKKESQGEGGVGELENRPQAWGKGG